MRAQPLLNHRYRILKSLGEGGFGRTFLAEDTHMPSLRQCVVKQLRPKSNNPDVIQLLQDRFAREAAVLEALGRAHSQIPTLYAYFARQSEFYLVQEWIEGETLSIHSQGSEEEAKALLISLLETLIHVHQQNIIHRDIKPENIILRSKDQLPCLIDFGAVKEVMSTVLSPSGALKSSLVIGTPGFMPPEQMSGHPVFASDLYSLGLTMIYWLSGRSPTEIPTDSHTGQRLWQQYAPGITEQLATVLTKATLLRASDRYTTAAEMLAALSPISQPSVAAKPSPSVTVATTALSSPFPAATNRFNWPNLSTVLKGLTVAGIAGICLFIQFGPPLQRSSNDPAIESVDESVESLERSNNGAASSTQTRQTPSNDPTSPLANAAALYEDGKNAAALEEVERVLADDPQWVSAIALKADILANQTQRDLPGAIKLYTQALTLEPDNLEVLTKRCKTYATLKDWAAAELDCTKAISIAPSSVELYGRRGDIRTAQANYEGAVDDYTQAIELNASAGNEQQNQSLYFRRFEAFGKLNRPEEALADMERARSLPLTEPTAD